MKRNRVQPPIEELLGEAVARIRAMRREERIQGLMAQGWSREAAVEFVRGGGGPVSTWVEDQDPRRTKRGAQNKPLAARPSGRRRSNPPRRWRRWGDGAR
jgi:hypothetical protein